MRVIRSLFRFVLRSAVVVGVVSLFLRLVRQRQVMPGASQDPDRPAPRPARPAPAAGGSATRPAAAADKPSAAAPWVPPEDSACPVTHPVKAKEASGIYHVPGGLSYDRTAPDRCYRDIEAAEADGYRQSKR